MTRRQVLFGIVCAGFGAFAALAAVGAIYLLDDESDERPGVVSTSCAGAPVEVTLAYTPGQGAAGVTAHVVIVDLEGRTWRVRYRGWPWENEEVPLSKGSEVVGQASALLGDADDGPRRSISVRPKTTTQWCNVETSIE